MGQLLQILSVLQYFVVSKSLMLEAKDLECLVPEKIFIYGSDGHHGHMWPSWSYATRTI